MSKSLPPFPLTGSKDGPRRGPGDPRTSPNLNLREDSAGGLTIDVADMPLDILARRLRGMRGTGPTFMAPCPAHRDSTPSLAVTETADGTVLLHCFAGCSVENVLEAVNLELRHLYPSGYARQFNRRKMKFLPSPPRPQAGPVEEPDIDHDRFRQLSRASRKSLGKKLFQTADNLGVTVDALNLLRVGVANDRAVFLERDDRRRPVGVCYRTQEGARTFAKGGRRGLSIPFEQPTKDGPLYVTEGATDTAALLSAGVQAIGRPAAKPSALATLWLARYLGRRPDREIVIMGDNDDPDGGEGVGEVAARELSTDLTVRLGRPVKWALPKSGFNDVRDQVVAGEWGNGVTTREVRA